MREEFLHYLWRSGSLSRVPLQTTQGENIEILSPGISNANSGPDFINAHLVIGDQEWAGKVEIHLRSSDWYVHGHEEDPAYQTVILHVVWEADVAVFNSSNTLIPTVAVSKWTPRPVLNRYRYLFSAGNLSDFNCHFAMESIDPIIWKKLLESMYFERLKDKVGSLDELLRYTKNHWERVFFIWLFRAFGTHINRERFQLIGRTLDLTVVLKIRQNPQTLEALFFGMAGLLNGNPDEDPYCRELQKEFSFLRTKYKLSIPDTPPVEFFKLRPANFPTIRLSQMAHLIANMEFLFDRCMKASSIDEYYSILKCRASPYWDTHYSFGMRSRDRVKWNTRSFIDLLLINTVVPIRLAYGRYIGKDETAKLLQIVTGIKAERNSITNKYRAHGVAAENVVESQGMIQLFKNYCSKNNCLTCTVGHLILNGK